MGYRADPTVASIAAMIGVTTDEEDGFMLMGKEKISVAIRAIAIPPMYPRVPPRTAYTTA